MICRLENLLPVLLMNEYIEIITLDKTMTLNSLIKLFERSPETWTIKSISYFYWLEKTMIPSSLLEFLQPCSLILKKRETISKPIRKRISLNSAVDVRNVRKDPKRSAGIVRLWLSITAKKLKKNKTLPSLQMNYKEQVSIPVINDFR